MSERTNADPGLYRQLDHADAEPECDGPATANGRNWRYDRVTGGLLAFFEPCDDCFDGADVIDDGTLVVRATGFGERLHRPQIDRGQGVIVDGGHVYERDRDACLADDCDGGDLVATPAGPLCPRHAQEFAEEEGI